MTTNRIMRVLCVICAALSFSATAETYTLHANSSRGTFYNELQWINSTGVTEKVKVSAGNAYIVDQSRVIDCGYTATFAGDSLQLGHVGGTYGRIRQTTHDQTATIGNLILEKGYYTIWQSSNGWNANMAGNAVVRSPVAAPFTICPTHDAGANGYTVYWKMAMSGEAGTGLRIARYPDCSAGAANYVAMAILTGDNSNYFGAFDVIGTNVVLKIAAGSALGGTLATFNPEALVLNQWACLMPQNTSATLASTVNRGICVKGAGAFLQADAGQTLRIEWPFCGTGVVVKRGAGLLTLDSAWSQSGLDATESLVVDAGKVRFGARFSNLAANPITVNKGAFVGAEAGATCTLNGFTTDGCGFEVIYDESSGASGVLVIPDGLPTDKVYPVLPAATRGVKVPFLKVPISAGTLTASNFVLSEDIGPLGLPGADITVEEADGYYVVSSTAHPLITNVGGPVYPCRYYANRWSDGKLPHAGADYKVSSSAILGSTDMPSDFTFPGGALYLESMQWDFIAHSFTADIRGGSYTTVRAFSSGADKELHLCGTLHVSGTASSDSGFCIVACREGMSMFIDSRMTGSTRLTFERETTKTHTITNATLVLTGDNPYSGCYFIYTTGDYGCLKLRFAKEANLGTNPSSWIKDGILLQGRGELYPIGSPTVSSSNRQVRFFYGSSGVRVDDGETFTLNSPIDVYNAIVYKRGGGVWSIGGTVTIDKTEKNPQISVNEGYLQDAKATACSALIVSVDDGAGIAATYRDGATDNASKYGMWVKDASKFVVNGQRLMLRAQTLGAKVRVGTTIPVLTVPQTLATTLDAKTIVTTTDAVDLKARLVKDTVTVDSVTYARYSAKLTRGGFSVIIH